MKKLLIAVAAVAAAAFIAKRHSKIHPRIEEATAPKDTESSEDKEENSTEEAEKAPME